MGTRALNDIELAEVRLVFHDSLDTSRVQISESSSISNGLGRIGAVYRRTPVPKMNAFTLGNTSFFPIPLSSAMSNHPDWLRDVGWLMHELTHQWQYQQFGILYLFQAIISPTYVYAPPGQSPNQALTGFTQAGKHFKDFNREQQGDIIRDYYFNLKQNQNVSGWEPYLQELRTPARRLIV
jgi:hypothetical protein